MQRYRLASPELKLPMPERGLGILFTADPDGEAINPLNQYYARMIASGELVPVETKTSRKVD